MTARQSTIFYQSHTPPAGVSLLLFSKLLLVASLFFVLAGNISLTAAGDESSSTAMIRAAGLACGIGCLLIIVSRQADLRIDAVAL